MKFILYAPKLRQRREVMARSGLDSLHQLSWSPQRQDGRDEIFKTKLLLCPVSELLYHRCNAEHVTRDCAADLAVDTLSRMKFVNVLFSYHKVFLFCLIHGLS